MVFNLKERSAYYYSLCIILICILFFSNVAIVKGEDITYIEINSSNINIKSDMDFSIYVNCTPTQAIKAYELQIQFNPSYLEALDVFNGDIFTGYDNFSNNGVIDNNNGIITDIYGLIVGEGKVSNPGSLVSVTFHTKSKTGSSTLSLLNVGITNELGYIPIETQNVEITISSDGNYIPPIDNESEDEYNPPTNPELINDGNNAPDQPNKPVGSTIIEKGLVYNYSSSSIDNDDDLIRLKFDWGDGNFSDWSDYVSSNKLVKMNHSWNNISNYNLRVIAQDLQGENSSWSEPLEIMVIQTNNSDNDIPTKNISNIMDFLEIGNITYLLIDLDNDGKINVFFNQITQFNSTFNYLDDNNIIIDLEGDGNWDYIYNFDNKLLSNYNIKSEDSNSKILIINPLFFIFTFIIILLGVLILFRYKIYINALKIKKMLIQSNKSVLINMKKLADRRDTSLLKHNFPHFFSNEEKNFYTKPTSNQKSKPTNLSFKISDNENEYFDDYSRMTTNTLESLSKKNKYKDLSHHNIINKIDQILDTNEDHIVNSRIFDIEKKVDRLFIDKFLFERD